MAPKDPKQGRGFFASIASTFSAVTKSVNGLVGYEGLEVINPDGGTDDVHEEASKGRWKQEDRDGYWKVMQKYVGADVTSMIISIPSDSSPRRRCVGGFRESEDCRVNPHTHQLKLCDFWSAKVLSEPDRIVGELLQPGGYLKLIELGLEDCANESIDAQKVFGYALYKDGKDTTLSYPLEAWRHLLIWTTAIYGVGRLMLPFPSPKRMWLGFLLILSASHIIFSLLRYHVPRYWLKPSQNLLVVFEELAGDVTKIDLLKVTHVLRNGRPRTEAN
ncbi:hypothetical protein ABKV19_017389 [Rosa sericea]